MFVARAVSATAQPVTFGVPFPRGRMRSGRPWALNFNGATLPVHARCLGTWGDGSVRWLLIEANCPALPTVGIHRGELVEIDEATSSEVSTTFSPENSAAQVGVRVDGLKLCVDKRTGAAELRRAADDDRAVGRLELIFRDARDRRRPIEVDHVETEVSGSQRATILVQGRVRGLPHLRIRWRWSLFAGLPFVRADVALHNTRAAKHRGGLWDLGDPGSCEFRELSWQVSQYDSSCGTVSWKVAANAPPSESQDGYVEIYQDSSGGEHWNSRNHVNAAGRVPCRFRGFRTTTSSGRSMGLRASPSVALGRGDGAIAAAVPEFWQQFPKLLRTTAGELQIGLFPREWDDVFELQGGERKTHVVWLAVGKS
ncbi:MAG: hypothetical protein JNL96_07140, partial [Planctomycetaceae bacterium]|nr:hypothetical protein [Planctomycetaceae bacterium]